jgi:hypothetical protein
VVGTRSSAASRASTTVAPASGPEGAGVFPALPQLNDSTASKDEDASTPGRTPAVYCRIPAGGPPEVNCRAVPRPSLIVVFLVGCASGGSGPRPMIEEDAGLSVESDAALGKPDTRAPEDRAATDSGLPADARVTPADTGAPSPDVAVAGLDAPLAPGPGMLVEHDFKPKDTDPAIDKWLDDHVAILDTRVPAQGKLFLFLAGGNGSPKGTVEPMQEAAKLGFHALGVTYCTDILVADWCIAGKDTDPDCSGKMRTEVLEGMDLSPHMVITPSNSIESRLGKALVYLQQKFPAEGWGKYLDGGKAKWSEILVAGRSLGGSMVARIAQRRAVFRAEIHSAPGDSLIDGGAAPWLKEPSLTPPERIFAFGHTGDPGHANQKNAWAALGLPGPPTSVDGARPPYGGSHQLITSAPTGNPHGSTTAGGDSPKAADGSYRFMPVWRQMMGF